MTRAIMPGVLSTVLVIFTLTMFATSPPRAAAQQTADGAAAMFSQAPPPQPSSALNASVADFAWLAGHWRGAWGPRLAQQDWMTPQAGVMVGVFQLTENHKTLVVELFTVSDTPRGVELRVRRFTPSLTPWEKLGPVVLRLKNDDSKSAAFENADNGQPKHWLVKRIDADTYLARFEIVPLKGEAQIAEITYHRQKEAAPAHR